MRNRNRVLMGLICIVLIAAAEKELVTKLVSDIKGVKNVKKEMTIGESR